MNDRRYPERPIVGVGAVVVAGDGRVVLVRRGTEPLKGRWSVPGGALEVGERLEDGVAREVLEETNLVVDVQTVLGVFDHIERDGQPRVVHHYVLVDYLCRIVSGFLEAGSDVEAVTLADPAALSAFGLTEQTAAVIAQGIAQRAVHPS